MSVPNHHIMRDIQSRDPDGGDRRPTKADRAAFRQWVMEMYGYRAWDHYQTNWDGMVTP